MKRLLGHAFAVSLFGALAIVPSACADNDQSIFVQFVFRPPQNRQNGACLYQADPTQPMMPDGVLDVGATGSYRAWLLVGSQLIGRGDTNAGRAESNRVHINGGSVRVTDANGGGIAEFSSVGSTFIDVQQNNVPGYAVLGLELINAPTADGLRAGLPTRDDSKLVLANLKIFGKTLGGVDLESGEFQFPIKVCNGCLVSFAGADDPADNVVDCNLPLGDNAGNTVLPCQPGQDEYTPCQVCSGPACFTPVPRRQ